MQWYPGHIARAEKLLREQLKAVDAVVEAGPQHDSPSSLKHAIHSCVLSSKSLTSSHLATFMMLKLSFHVDAT